MTAAADSADTGCVPQTSEPGSSQREPPPGSPAAKPLVRWLYFLPAFVYMGTIWCLSSHPSPDSLQTWPVFMDIKVTHIIEYSLLALLWLVGFGGTSALRPEVVYPLTVGLTALWGVLDEFHQAFTPTRTPALADALTDLLAAVICVEAHFLLTALARRLPQRRRSSRPQ